MFRNTVNLVGFYYETASRDLVTMGKYGYRTEIS